MLTPVQLTGLVNDCEMKTYNSWLLIQQVETCYKHDLCKKIAALFHHAVSEDDGSTVANYIPGDLVTL